MTPAGTSINSDPLPGLAIFTPSHYSLIWMPGEKAMRELQQRWVPTDAEMIQRYGEIVVNSGVYTQAESTLTLEPIVSRVPEFMGGGTLVYEYRVDVHHLDWHAPEADFATGRPLGRDPSHRPEARVDGPVHVPYR